MNGTARIVCPHCGLNNMPGQGANCWSCGKPLNSWTQPSVPTSQNQVKILGYTVVWNRHSVMSIAVICLLVLICVVGMTAYHNAARAECRAETQVHIVDVWHGSIEEPSSLLIFGEIIYNGPRLYTTRVDAILTDYNGNVTRQRGEVLTMASQSVTTFKISCPDGKRIAHYRVELQ